MTASSLWLEEAAAGLPRWDAARPEMTCDVLVIGAGLAGCSAALALQERGLDVLVVERDAPGFGASGRNAGFLLLAHVFELPDMQRRLGADAVGALLALGRRNHALLRERFAEAAAHRASGSLMLSMEGDAEEAGALEQAAQILRSAGVETTLGAPHPALRGFGAQLALPEDGQLHPGRLVAAMASRIQRGALGRVLRLEDGAAHLEGGARIRFRRALVATNANAAQLVPTLGGIVTPERAQMLATEPLPARLLEPVAYACWGYDYFRQRDDGVLLLGGRRHLFTAAESTDVTDPSDEVQAALDAYLEAHLPFAAGARITHRWAGTMGFSPDELPLMGPAAGMAGGVDVLVGFTGHGLGLATVLAELWADIVADRAGEEDRRLAAVFSSARFA